MASLIVITSATMIRVSLIGIHILYYLLNTTKTYIIDWSSGKFQS